MDYASIYLNFVNLDVDVLLQNFRIVIKKNAFYTFNFSTKINLSVDTSLLVFRVILTILL